MATTESNQRSVWPTLLLIAIITLLGGVVRWLIAATDPMWLDELHTSWVVAGELGDVYQRAQIGNQTPLFFWLTWAAAEIFGETEISLRLISLIAGTATIFAAGWIVFRWTGSTIAAATTSILIAFDAWFHTQFIFHATEARPYALVQFLSVVQVALFWRLFFGQPEPVDQNSDSQSSQLDDQAKTAQPKSATRLRWLLLPLVTALLFYAHYTSAWLFATQGIFVAILLLLDAAFRRRNLKKLLVVTGTTALFLIPALPQLSQLLGRRSNWASVSSSRELLLQQALPFGCWMVAPIVALAIAMLIHPPVPKSAATKSAAKSNQIKLICFVFLWAILPTVFAVALDRFQFAPIALVRYTLVGAVAMPVFAGMVIGIGSHPRMRTVLSIGLIALTLILSPVTSGKFLSSGFDIAELPRLRWENWGTAIDEINANQAKKSQPVFLASNLIEDVEAFEESDPRFQEYLRFPVNGIHRIENQKSANDANQSNGRKIIAIPTLLVEHLRQSDIEKICESGGAWLIVRGTRELVIEIEDEIVNKLAALHPEAPQLKTTRLGPLSDVYLISFD